MPIDFADQSQDIIERFLEDSLKNCTIPTPPLSGFCLSCEEPVVQRRFCDSTCREDFYGNQKR